MIISTNKSDMMLKRSLGKDKTVIIAIDKMLDQFALDPTMMNPKRDAYIVTNEDISAKRLKDKFEQALASKHPATKVIFINKSSKPIYQQGLPGLDAILQKPKPNDITQTISAVTAQASIEGAVESQVAPIVEIPEYTPEVRQEYVQPEPEPETQPIVEPEPLPPMPEPVPEPVPEPEPVNVKSGLVERIERAGTVGDAVLS